MLSPLQLLDGDGEWRRKATVKILLSQLPHQGRKPLPSEHGRSQAARLISGSVGTPPLYHSVSHQEGPRSRDATERSSPIIFSVRPQLILPGVGPAEPALLHSTQTWDAADWTCAVHCPVRRKSIDQETCYLRRDVSDDIDGAVLTNSIGVLVRVSGDEKQRLRYS